MSRYSSEKYYELPVLDRKESLPLENNSIGDRYLFNDEIYIWNGNFWVEATLLSAPDALLITTYLLRGPSSVNEGEDFTVTLETQNVDNGTELAYTITGTVNSTDLDGESLTGTLTVQDNAAEVSFTHVADGLSDGSKTFILTLDNGESSIVIELADTSQQPVPTYTLSSSEVSVNEGGQFTIYLTTTAVAEGTVVPFTISGISADDLIAPGLTTLTGSFTVASDGTDGWDFFLSEDLATEGTEVFTLTLDGTSNNIQVNINDTSTAPVPSGSQSYTTPGIYTFTVPAGVNEVHIFAVGAGGGGQLSRGSSTGTERAASGGGGAGSAWASYVPVTPGQTFSVGVPAGGVGGTVATQTYASDNGSAGGSASISGISGFTLFAQGGTGGGSSGGRGGVGNVSTSGLPAGNRTIYGIGRGGDGTSRSSGLDGGGGGGAGGYGTSSSPVVQARGGNGGVASGSDGTYGSGGGGASAEYQNQGGFDRFGGNGGGVGINGRGSNGAGASQPTNPLTQQATSGSIGSGGNRGYGGGGDQRAFYGGSASASNGGSGAVNIRWGEGETFP